MAKKVKIGGMAVVKTIEVEIAGKTYSVPLAGAMKRKELLELNNEDKVYQMFAKHIPAEVLDDLTLDEYKQLANAWAEANESSESASVGES